MGGNVEAVKERLDIAEVIGAYIPLQKAGINFKAKCPFHNEKTASFFVSSARQNYYCFGCGAKGDIFTFVEEMEGVEFKEALKTLADRAGVKLVYDKGKTDDKDKLYEAEELAAQFFESEINKAPEALKYLESRGLKPETVKSWRIGFARDEWRLLKEHMNSLGYKDDLLLRAGLIKRSDEHKDKEAYDTFRGRVIFPIFDPKGDVIAFSGRALGDVEPKYLNSPDSSLFNKSETLYGLDKAREEIRRNDYAVLVEGQMDLVLSHQAGVKNTVASSGTAFTELHLQKLRRISQRIILAFDSDEAGRKAALRSTALALSLGMEVKIAKLPDGKDPADMVRDDPESWKEALRKSKPAIEIFLDEILEREKDPRRVGKEIERRLLPVLALVQSHMERAHFVSLIGKRTGLKDEVIWADLKKVKSPEAKAGLPEEIAVVERPRRSRMEELQEVLAWINDDPSNQDFQKQKSELEKRIKIDELDKEIASLRLEVSHDKPEVLKKIAELSKEKDEVVRSVL